MSKSFFSEIVASISDARYCSKACYLSEYAKTWCCVSFTKDGRYIISRDYLTLKIWDINMERRPVEVCPKGYFLTSR